MAKKSRARKSAPKPKARRARKPKADGQAAAGGIPGTTVVHVDREVYAALQVERRPQDRGYNAPLRRLIGLDPKAAPAGELAEAAV